jgi:hypothetical protein
VQKKLRFGKLVIKLSYHAKVNHYLPTTILTGDGNDTVDIRLGDDGRVHINVNGKEAWTGTQKEFQYVTIDTGGGKDVVANYVDGATIRTGSKADTCVE